MEAFYKGEQNVFLHYAARTITRSPKPSDQKALYGKSRFGTMRGVADLKLS